MQNSTPSKSAIFTLAHQLIAKGICQTISEALKAAWKQAKTETIQVIRFTKKSGELTKRVVTRNLSNYYKPSNSGRTKPSNLLLFVDMAKVVAGAKSVIISTYPDQLIAA